MKSLSGQLVGGAVHFLDQIVVVGGDAPARRSVLLFGLQHLTSHLFYSMERGSAGANYLPKWLEALALTAPQTSATAILLEIPPLSPEIVEDAEVEKTIKADQDAILAHSLARLRPLFVQGGTARTHGWVLDGIDLRYRFRHEQRGFMQSSHGLRWSLHKDLADNLPKWNLDLQSLRKAYTYLTGMSSDQSRLDTFVEQYCAAAGNQQKDVKVSIFAQAAAHCRPLYEGVDEGAKLSIVEFLVDEARTHMAKSEQEYADHSVPKKYPDSGTDNLYAYEDINGYTAAHEYTESLLQHAVAEHLVDLAILGHILSPESGMNNVVVVAGNDHVLAIRRFFNVYRAVVRAGTAWPALDQIKNKIKVAEASYDGETESVLQTQVDGTIILQ